MVSIIIQDLDESLKAKLQLRAAQYGRSIEEEIQMILTTVLENEVSPKNLGERIHQRFLSVGGFDLPEIEREPVRDLPLFDAQPSS